MIIGSTKNLMDYKNVLNNLKEGLDAINALESLELGRYEFEGGFFMIQEGETSPISEGDYEAHKKYVDVQMILKGAEEVAWLDYDETEFIDFNESMDKITCSGNTDISMLIKEGMFWAAYPNDAHKPGKHTKNKHSYKKIVLKLPAK